MAKAQKSPIQFVICINNSEADLQKGKIYKVLRDESAAKSKYTAMPPSRERMTRWKDLGRMGFMESN